MPLAALFATPGDLSKHFESSQAFGNKPPQGALKQQAFESVFVFGSVELNPVEQVWQWLRQHVWSNRVFTDYEDIMDACCLA